MMSVLHVRINLFFFLKRGVVLRNTRKPVVIMTSLITMVLIPRSRLHWLRKASPDQLMKKTTAQMVLMRAFSTVDSVENHSLSGRYCRFMSALTCLANLITVATAPSPLITQMNCACTLSFTLVRSHLSAAIVLDHSLEQQRCTTMCARIQVKKPFSCERCGKTFTQASQLHKHEVIPGDCVPCDSLHN